MSIIASDLNSTAHARAHTPSCGGRRVPYEQDGAGQLQDLRPGLYDALLRHGRRPLARQPSQVQRGRVDQLDGDTSYLGRGQKGRNSGTISLVPWSKDNLICGSECRHTCVHARAKEYEALTTINLKQSSYNSLTRAPHTRIALTRTRTRASHTHEYARTSK